MKFITALLILPNYKDSGAKMKRPVQRKLLRVLFLAMAVPLTLTGASAEKAAAAVYYMSPTGSDSNPGTSFSPWRTFSFAIPRLNPGDTLILKDGTYTASNTTINCGSNARNGTASQPITIKAENERQAHLHSTTGYTPLLMYNCSHWRIDGLRISNANNRSETNWGGHIYVKDSSNIIIRRLLVHNTNAWTNDHPITAHNSRDVLIDENEVYSFHRHGITIINTSNATVRRNYVNGRGYDNFGPLGNGPNRTRDQEAISCYPCFDSVFENNITENVYTGVTTLAAPASGSRNVRVLGNIARDALFSFHGYSYGDSEGAMTRDILWVDNVAVNIYEGSGGGRGHSAGNMRNWTYRNNSSLVSGGNSRGVFVDMDVAPYNCCPPFSVNYENHLITGMGSGFVFTSDNSYTVTINSSNVYNSGTALIGNVRSGNGFTGLDPQLGACRVFIPASSPMKGAGKDGADIGANVLYRYENGVLTNQPLWNPITGEFPHGAVVPGVNDIPGSSAFDVHQRLNVNANGCSLPAGYGGSTTDSGPSLPVVSRPSAPKNLQVLR